MKDKYMDNVLILTMRSEIQKMSHFVTTARACLLTACRYSVTNYEPNLKITPNTDCDIGFLMVGDPYGKESSVIDNSDFTIASLCGNAFIAQIGKN